MLIVVHEKQEFILKKTLYMYFVIKKNPFIKTVTFRNSNLKFQQKREGKNQIQVGDKNMIIREIIK